MSYQFTYYGHGTFGLRINDHKIVIDPFFTNNPSTKTKPEDIDPDFLLNSLALFNTTLPVIIVLMTPSPESVYCRAK